MIGRALFAFFLVVELLILVSSVMSVNSALPASFDERFVLLIRFLLRNLLNFRVSSPSLLDNDLASFANLASSMVKHELLPQTIFRKEQVCDLSSLWLKK